MITRVANPGFPDPENPGFRAFSETRKPGFDSTKTRVFGKSHILAIFSLKIGHIVQKYDSFCFHFRTLDILQTSNILLAYTCNKIYLLSVFTQFFNSHYRSKTAILKIPHFEKEIVMSYCD